jgi:hypothetical protein
LLPQQLFSNSAYMGSVEWQDVEGKHPKIQDSIPICSWRGWRQNMNFTPGNQCLDRNPNLAPSACKREISLEPPWLVERNYKWNYLHIWHNFILPILFANLAENFFFFFAHFIELNGTVLRPLSFLPTFPSGLSVPSPCLPAVDIKDKIFSFLFQLPVQPTLYQRQVTFLYSSTVWYNTEQKVKDWHYRPL